MHSPSLILAALALVLPLASAQQAKPDASHILKGARMSAALVNLPEGLAGSLQKDGAKTPVTVFLMGRDMQFQLPKTREIFHLRMGDEELNLFEIVNGKTINFPEAKLSQPIAGTDVAYEDLALRFLYWPNPRIEGEEAVNGFDCYKLRVDRPKKVAGRIAAVYVWVSKKYGAFMSVRGYDKAGLLVKEFQVRDVMPITDKIWGLRKMEVSSYDTATGRKSSITHLIFESPRKLPGKPGGLR